MLGDVQTVDRRLFMRRCVSCGCDAATINRVHTQCCPRCGCDLAERPPRSYAEMEGLLGMPTLTHQRSERDARIERSRNERLMHRWLAFFFLAMLGLLAIVYLSAAAMPV